MRNNQFDTALYGIPQRIKKFLLPIPDYIKEKTEEIRIRANAPLVLTVSGKTVFIRNNGQISYYATRDLFLATEEDLDECFRLLCQNSVYAHTEELKNGFIIMKNGCRAGVCGSLNETGFMKEVTSVNIRIAREIIGAANDIMAKYSGGGLLIAGPPASGKTTVLRDAIRQLSSSKRITVIDSRGEISGGADLGANTDVLKINDRALGIEIALRTMNPDIIAFDEIGNMAELKKVGESLYAGAYIITTAHIGSAPELLRRNVTAGLIKSGAIEEIALLSENREDKISFIKPKELESYATV